MTSVRCLQSAESTQYSNEPINIGHGVADSDRGQTTWLMQEQRLAQVKTKSVEERPTYKVWLRRSICGTKLLAESAGHYVGKGCISMISSCAEECRL